MSYVVYALSYFDWQCCLLSFLQSVGNKEASGPQTQSYPRSSVPFSVPPVEQRPESSSPVRKPPDSSPDDLLPPPSSHTESEAESLLEELQHSKKQAGLAGEAGNTTSYFHTRSSIISELGWPRGAKMCLFVCPAADLEVPVQVQIQTEPTAEGVASSVSVSAPKVSIPSSAHHYCFSLDLRSLGSLSLTHPIAAMLRWKTSHIHKQWQNFSDRKSLYTCEVSLFRHNITYITLWLLSPSFDV